MTEGLDGAINIDRESFNYSHPHFLYLQRWLHRALRLLVNRLKALAKEDLERERSGDREHQRALLEAFAAEVWYRRYGEEADPPISPDEQSLLPTQVGSAEIRWRVDDVRTNTQLSALSVVLEAYGALSSLPVEDRAELVRDVLSTLGYTK